MSFQCELQNIDISSTDTIVQNTQNNRFSCCSSEIFNNGDSLQEGLVGDTFERTDNKCIKNILLGTAVATGLAVTYFCTKGKVKKSGSLFKSIHKSPELKAEMKELKLFRENVTKELKEKSLKEHAHDSRGYWRKYYLPKVKQNSKCLKNVEFCRLYKSVVEDSFGRNFEPELRNKIQDELFLLMGRTNSKINLEMVNTIFKDSSISNSELKDILSAIDSSNKNILEEVFADKNFKFTKDLIKNITQYCNWDNEKLARELLFNKDLGYPLDLSFMILNKVHKYTNLEIAENMCLNYKTLNIPQELIPQALEASFFSKETSKPIERLCSANGLNTLSSRDNDYYDYGISLIKTYKGNAESLVGKFISNVNETPNNKFNAAIKTVLDRSISKEEAEFVNILKNVLGDNSASSILIADLLKNKTIASIVLNNKYWRIDIADFAKYVQNVNFEEISKIAPRVKDYGPVEKLEFLKMHYIHKTKEFTPQTLTLNNDFTEYLKTHPTGRRELAEILTVCPLTERNIGKMPEEWFKNIPENQIPEVENQIQKLIDEFRINRDLNAFASKLQQLINANVIIKPPMKGSFANVYKLTIGDTSPVALKIFNRYDACNITQSRYNQTLRWDQFKGYEYGMHAEPQLGIFANNNSDKFVPLRFGRAAGPYDRDGYLVTDFLKGPTDNYLMTGLSNNPNWVITHHDANTSENIIANKIIDFGGIEIVPAGI